MSQYHDAGECTWVSTDVRGSRMETIPIFEEHNVLSALFRMPPGCVIPAHHHTNWVQVVVISGQLRVEQVGKPMRRVFSGGVYFVAAGEDHTETAEELTVVLVTQGEYRYLELPEGKV
jgi:quercetin dioxygenase-like cupin family protein